jgi:hypothetical protein
MVSSRGDVLQIFNRRAISMRHSAPAGKTVARQFGSQRLALAHLFDHSTRTGPRAFAVLTLAASSNFGCCTGSGGLGPVENLAGVDASCGCRVMFYKV